MLRRFLKVSLILSLIVVFSACNLKFLETEEEVSQEESSEKNEKVEKLEEKLEKIDEDEDEDVDEDVDVDVDVDLEGTEEAEEETVAEVEVEEKTESFIKLDKPANNSTLTKEPIIFSGQVSENTEKIVVTANLPERGGDIGGESVLDVYTLEDFELGDEEFVYRAKEAWGNLYPGSTHVFDFEAYFEDGSTEKTSVTIEFMPVIESFITLDSPKDGSEFYDYDVPIEFKGKVSADTKKIVVKAWQEDGYFEGYEDIYTLQNFEQGDTSFTYRVSEDWSNLARGPNNYEFTAYFDDGTTETVWVSINYYDHGGFE